MNIKILSVLLMMFFLVGTVSAYDFDNKKTYDPITRTATVTNLYGVGGTIGEARLNTPLNVRVGLGYQKVAEFNIQTYDEKYTNIIKDFEFINLKDNKEILRSYDLKYKTYEDVLIDDFKISCYTDEKSINKTQICKQIKVGSHKEKKEVWKEVTQEILINNKILTIGIFTEVKKGDYVEWIPTIYGKEINEWATWTESLNTGLISYYKLDEASGIVLDALEVNDGTNDGSVAGVTGKIGTAYNFTAGDFDNINLGDANSLEHLYTGERSISAWIKVDNIGATYKTIFAKGTNVNPYEGFTFNVNHQRKLVYTYRVDYGSNIINAVTDDAQINVVGQWYHVVMTYKNENITFYVDGSLVASTIDVNSISSSVNTDVDANIGVANDGTDAPFSGLIDELGVWDRTLSSDEILDLYNGGDGISYTNVFNVAPNITLNSPSSANYTTQQSLTINFTASDDLNLSDVKLYVNDILNQTNATGINNSNYIFPLNLGDGDYTIYGKATDNESQETNSDSVRIVIDTLNPTFNITSPVDDIITTSFPVNATLNGTTTDTNLDTCWYFTSDNSTNITYACNTETNISFNTGGDKTIYIFANDTLGNEAGDETTFLINYIQESATYNATVLETESHSVILNITASEITTFNGTLHYNGTDYTTTASDDGTTGLLTRSLTVPTLSANELVYFNWTYNLNGVDYNTSNYNQTLIYITPINITSASCDDKALRFDIQDETNLTALYGEIEYNFKYGIGNDTLKEIYGSITNATTFYICINASVSETYNIGYGEIQYRDAGYVDRRHYLFNGRAISNNTLANITLRDLPTTDQTSFLLTMEDTSLNVYAEKYTALWRWYPDLNEYQIVEMGKTDESGQTVAHVDIEDVDYRVGLYETDGTLIKLGDPLRFVCSSSPCSFTLRVGGTTIDYSTIYDVQAEITYNQTTGMFRFIYNDPSEDTSSMRFEVTRITGSDTLVICNDTSAGFTGAMVCNTSMYTGYKKAVAYRTASPSVIIAEKIVNELNVIFNSGFGLFITVFLWLAIVLSGFGNNPIWTIILAIVGMIPALMMGAINIAIFTGIAVLGALIIHFIKRAVAQ